MMTDERPAAPPRGSYLCANRELAPSPMMAMTDPDPYRAEALRLCARKWNNGTTLDYCLLERSLWQWDDIQRAAVRAAFKTWQDLGIGLKFREVTSEANAKILIGHLMDDDSFSFVGTDVLHYRDRERTMNLAVDLTTTWGFATALHEIGHTLGLEHEHQNPRSGIQWNEPVAFEMYRQSTGWDDAKIRRNIFDKKSPNDSQGSIWDPQSIMHYPVQPRAMLLPHPYDATGVGENTVLSQQDRAWVRYWYPADLAMTPIDPGSCKPLAAQPGAQSAFKLTPLQSGFYTMSIQGQADTVMVLFEDIDGELQQIAAANDAATEENATITAGLRKGISYRIQVRTVYANNTTEPLLFVE